MHHRACGNTGGVTASAPCEDLRARRSGQENAYRGSDIASPRLNLCYVEVFNTTLSRTFRSRNERAGRCTPATRMPTARWVACARCRRRCAAEPEGVARGRCLSPQFLNSESQSSLKSLRAEDSRYQKSRYETGQSLGATALVLWTLLIQNVLILEFKCNLKSLRAEDSRYQKSRTRLDKVSAPPLSLSLPSHTWTTP